MDKKRSFITLIGTHLKRSTKQWHFPLQSHWNRNARHRSSGHFNGQKLRRLQHFYASISRIAQRIETEKWWWGRCTISIPIAGWTRSMPNEEKSNQKWSLVELLSCVKFSYALDFNCWSVSFVVRSIVAMAKSQEHKAIREWTNEVIWVALFPSLSPSHVCFVPTIWLAEIAWSLQ